MGAVPFSADAAVLRATPYGEADLVVQLLVRGRGRAGAFARGARRSVHRFGGALEPFTLLRAELAERRGAELLDLRGATVLESFTPLRADLGRLAHAGYGAELVRELAREREPADPLLDLLVDFLGRLAAGQARSLRLRAFELAALGAAGVAPHLDACARCGGAPTAFDAEHGGAVCALCAGPGTLAPDRAALALLRALQRGGLAAADAAQDEGLPLEPVRRALRRFVVHQVGRELRSASFLRDVGAPL